MARRNAAASSISMPMGPPMFGALTTSRYFSPMAFRNARMTSTGKRIRFSRLPPYSSVRQLVVGFRNFPILKLWQKSNIPPSKPKFL